MADRILTSYYVVMIDYGQRGLEAIVQPELIRADIVAMIKSGEYPADRIAYIHHCDFGTLKDVTFELMDEADKNAEYELPHPQYVAWDKAAEYRKHGERV